MKIYGTCAHNSAPVYAAENFEIFKGRAAWNRFVGFKNNIQFPLQILDETELGLTYEANYAITKINKPSRKAMQFMSILPQGDVVRNKKWFKTYKLSNPIFEYTIDIELWLLGIDYWVIINRSSKIKKIKFGADLKEITRLLNSLHSGLRIVINIHPLYVGYRLKPDCNPLY